MFDSPAGRLSTVGMVLGKSCSADALIHLKSASKVHVHVYLFLRVTTSFYCSGTVLDNLAFSNSWLAKSFPPNKNIFPVGSPSVYLFACILILKDKIAVCTQQNSWI